MDAQRLSSFELRAATIFLRAATDADMRSKFLKFVEGNIAPIEKMFGVCALGTRISVYEFTPATGKILPVLKDDQDDALSEWSLGLFDEAGEAKFKEVVASVESMAESIAGTEYKEVTTTKLL
ncbi:hypothetical protein DXG01_005584 [Tephrocybe rancida]|nr:hypothetical protein DXG01_005584 [Tephrocybe rancida]